MKVKMQNADVLEENIRTMNDECIRLVKTTNHTDHSTYAYRILPKEYVASIRTEDDQIIIEAYTDQKDRGVAIL